MRRDPLPTRGSRTGDSTIPIGALTDCGAWHPYRYQGRPDWEPSLAWNSSQPDPRDIEIASRVAQAQAAAAARCGLDTYPAGQVRPLSATGNSWPGQPLANRPGW